MFGWVRPTQVKTIIHSKYSRAQAVSRAYYSANLRKEKNFLAQKTKKRQEHDRAGSGSYRKERAENQA